MQTASLGKKLFVLLLGTSLVLSLAGCGSKDARDAKDNDTFNVMLVPDTPGISDKSFNQSAWEGLKRFEENHENVKVNYVESKEASDFRRNLDQASDGDHGVKYDTIISMGYPQRNALLEVAAQNPDQTYVIVDTTFGDETPDNVTCLAFNAHEAGFLCGYIAAHTTKTNKVGFIGGMKNPNIAIWEYGFRAGVAFAEKEHGKKIEISSQFTDSFTDAAKGKAVASNMFSKGIDVIFPAAGACVFGVAEAAKEAGKWFLGVDVDWADIAPNNVLTSAIKDIGKALEIYLERVRSGEELGGQTVSFGLKEGCVGIPEENPNLPAGLYEETIDLASHIKDGVLSYDGRLLSIPYNEEMYKVFVQGL